MHLECSFGSSVLGPFVTQASLQSATVSLNSLSQSEMVRIQTFLIIINWLIDNVQKYTVGHKTWHFIFVNIFADYWPIFKILLPAHFADSLQ